MVTQKSAFLKVVQSFETPEATDQKTLCHIQEYWNSQRHPVRTKPLVFYSYIHFLDCVMTLFIAKISIELEYGRKWLWLNFTSEGAEGR